MILPDRVLGSSGTTRMVRGFAIGPMKFSLGAGYAFDRIRKGGYYTSIDGRIAF